MASEIHLKEAIKIMRGKDRYGNPIPFSIQVNKFSDGSVQNYPRALWVGTSVKNLRENRTVLLEIDGHPKSFKLRSGIRMVNGHVVIW